MKRFGLIAAVSLGGCSLVPGTSANLEKQARAALATNLFDVETARFDSLRQVTTKAGDKAEITICGDVNAKNRMGAYVGFRHFVVAPKDGFTIVDPQVDLAGTDDSDQAIKERATQAGFNAVWKMCE
jgi:hypothetical protein